MNILVTGSNGQLGSELKRMAAADYFRGHPIEIHETERR